MGRTVHVRFNVEGIEMQDSYKVQSFVAFHYDRSRGGLLRIIAEEGGMRNIAADSILSIR